MGTRFRKAWVTFAVDEKSVKNAIVLAQSLSRVAAVADIVVLTSMKLFHGVQGKQLGHYFDVVLSQNMDKLQKVRHSDHVKNAACSLQMYSTCIVIDSNKMVVKNCDELFDMDKDFAGVPMENQKNTFDTSVFVIKPKFYFLQHFSGLVAINGLPLSDVFSDFFSDEENSKFRHELSIEYNYSISNWLPNLDYIHTAKIIELGDIQSLKNTKTNSLAKEIINSWILFYETATTNINFGPSIMPKPNLATNSPSNGIFYKNAVAIVGHSCRLPGVNSIEEFWDLLKSGRDGISHIPSERLLDFQRNDSRFTESWGGFLKCPIDEFDANFFGISPREATYMDPQQRLLLEVAWEALENAAINPQILKGGSTGVFTGVWQHDYERLVAQNASVQDFHHVILGNAFSATSARVSYFLGLNGPNIAIESGCSSSMIGLHLACDSLRKEETNLCLVLGANILATNFPSSAIPILAKDGRCKTYDEKADGFARAEGVAGIVLKRLSDAIKNGDRILGIVRGSGVTNEGTSSSFGTPSKHCQEVAVREALKNAGISPVDVDYVEAHGTGTPVGDPIEFAALTAAYAGGNRQKPLLIGSVKTNTGHTESAAGLAGLIKVLLSLKHETIPPHINFDTINPSINLDVIPAKIPISCEDWKRDPSRKRIAGVSSFGIAGGNVHVILEEPPLHTEMSLPICELNPIPRIFTISAKSENALTDLSKKYIEYFRNNQNVNLADVVYTANNGRANFKFRNAFVATDIPELITVLESSTFEAPAIQTVKPKIAFLFTGQGSQYFGMGKEFYDSNMVFRNAFEKCDSYLQSTVGISLKCALWDDSQKHLLEQTMYSQLSIFAVEYSLLKLWESFDVRPELVLGHSVGEYAAAVAAGILSLKDALHLLVERSKLVDTVAEGRMLAVKASKEIVMGLILELSLLDANTSVDIACLNSPNETVVAGNRYSALAFKDFAAQKGLQIQLLASHRGFHSRDMDNIAKKFKDFSANTNFCVPNVGYVSGKTGKWLSATEMDSSYWAEHMRGTVNFEKGMDMLFKHGCNVFIEIGSHPVLLALGMSCLSYTEETIWLPSLRKKESCWKTILESLGKLFKNGSSVNWNALDQSSFRKKLELPMYPFQRRKYWTEYHISDDVALKLHPFLGRKVSLADQNVHIYENYLNLKEFQFLKDHQVANIIVLPAAIYLEMALACGRDIYNEIEGMTIEDFSVEAPLELEIGKRYKMQTMVFPPDSHSKIKLQIFVLQIVNGVTREKGWKLYSGAVLAPKNISSVSEIKEVDSLRNEKFDEIKLRCKSSVSQAEVYKYSSDAGIYFGGEFQSLKTIWKCTEEFFIEIRRPIKDYSVCENYVCHPLVLDAMIQVMGFISSYNEEDKHLCLPVAIKKFQSIRRCETSPSFYAHVIWNGQSKGTISLYSAKGDLLAFMEDVRLVRTSVNSFLNVINTLRNKMPGMYQENWRPRDAPLSSRLVLAGKFNDSRNVITDEICRVLKHEKQECSIGSPLNDKRNSRVYILKFLFDIGWSPKVDDYVSTRSFIDNFGLVLSVENIISRFFDILSEDGYLKKLSASSEWTVVQSLPTVSEVESEIEHVTKKCNEIEALLKKRHVPSFMAKYCIAQLPKICFGEETAHSVLFGNEDHKYNALSVYTDGIETKYCDYCISLYFQVVFKEFGSQGKNSGVVLRIIEIGAGSGATTKEIISGLKKCGVSFLYTFTDISQHFLVEAKNKFAGENNIEYKILDIEKEPLVQGFAPFHYDVVVASNVIHATANLHESMRNIRLLLRNRGFLILQEMLESQRAVDIIFGTLEGYWRFKDYDIRPHHPCVSKDIWDRVFLNCGFEMSQNISEAEAFTSVLCTRTASDFDIENLFSVTKKNVWILYCDNDGVYEYLEKMLKSVGREVYFIKEARDHKINEGGINCYYLNTLEFEELKVSLDVIFNRKKVEGFCYLRSISDYSWEDQRSICVPGLNILKYLISQNCSKIRFCAATNGVYYIRNQNVMCPHKATLVGMFKSAANEFPLSVKVIELDPDDKDASVYAAQLFHELFAGDDIITCFRANKKSVLRLNYLRTLDSSLSIPKDRYILVRPLSKKLEDLQFDAIAKSSLGPQEVEVLVKSVAINFRDLFVILQPDGFTSKYENMIGSDFAGIVSNVGALVTTHCVGDKVFGVATNTCVASHVIVEEELAITVPPHFTFSEAATIPSVFLTAYLCLVTEANLKEGETVLIHVASGGVGMIAIEIAKSLGACIIATAGSHRKRAYLRSLGIEHVFHSRDLSYETGIKKATGGKGADVVLNSLTGPGFKEATLSVCGLGARFIEIGKVNIWTHEKVKDMRPDLQYTVFDLENLDDDLLRKNIATLKNYVGKFTRCPMPYTQFPVSQIRDALNYFAKAEHIGKIILTMPGIREIDGQQKHFHLDDKATYMITGGLTGIGLEVANWLVDSGARNIVLLARSTPNENALKEISTLKAKGCRTESFQVDVGDWEQCSKLFDTIKSPKNKWPSLKGIIHSAVVLSDGLIANQTWENFESVFKAKVAGGWNLHHLSKDILLDYFVMFSSLSNLVGTIGQSNYNAAGMFLDSLVHYRHSIGLPAQTINWGAWATVGKSSNIDGFNEGRLGVTFFNPSQGIAALEYIMSRPHLKQVAVAQVDPKRLINLFGMWGNYLEELIVEKDDENSINETIASTETFWVEIDSLDLPGRVTYIKHHLNKLIKKTLRLSTTDTLDEFQNFSDMGLDSLMGIEMKNKLQNIVGKKLTLSTTSLLDYPTIHSLSQYLAQQTLTTVSETSLEANETKNDYNLIELDSILPEDIQCTKSSILKPLDIKNVLLTGSTGRLGVYLLKDLLKVANLKIYCLIRGKSIEQAQKKLFTAFKKFKLHNNVDINSLSIVIGDITEDQLGLTQENYETFSADIHLVIHLAIKANHIEKYVKANFGRADIRSVNVLGTVNILRFACNIKNKRVFYSSSYTTVNRLNEEGFVYENFPDEENSGDKLSWGYVLSKFVCEKLLKQANDRGIPCTMVRYLTLTGDSKTGVFAIEKNSFMNWIFMCIRYGVVNEMEGGWCFMPVDVASEATVKLLFNDNAELGVYNFTPPYPLYADDFVEVLSGIGYSLKKVSNEEFETTVLKDKENDPWISIFIDSYGPDIKTALVNFSAVATILKDKKRVYQISEKLLKAVPDFQSMLPKGRLVLNTYVKYADSSGMLKNMRQNKLDIE